MRDCKVTYFILLSIQDGSPGFAADQKRPRCAGFRFGELTVLVVGFPA